MPETEVDDGSCTGGEYVSETDTQKNMLNIEMVIDLFYTVEILFCFVKRTMAHSNLKSIA